MEWIIPLSAFITGGCVGMFSLALIFIGRAKDYETQIHVLNESDGAYKLLKARIRAIQDNAKPINKNEMVYSIQKPDGKFGKFQLPRV